MAKLSNLRATYKNGQIVYALQFYAVSPKDLKVIEKDIYAFVNRCSNATSPESIAHKLLIAPKLEGGMDGIDVESFVQAICARTHAKPANVHSELSKIQSRKKEKKPK